MQVQRHVSVRTLHGRNPKIPRVELTRTVHKRRSREIPRTRISAGSTKPPATIYNTHSRRRTVSYRPRLARRPFQASRIETRRGRPPACRLCLPFDSRLNQHAQSDDFGSNQNPKRKIEIKNPKVTTLCDLRRLRNRLRFTFPPLSNYECPRHYSPT